jgi:hypothetical protein
VVRYSRGSKALGIEAGTYARVEHVNAQDNRVTVRTDEGSRVTYYDPRRLQGVTLYRETERAFAAGDRVQMTAPDRTREVPRSSRRRHMVSMPRPRDAQSRPTRTRAAPGCPGQVHINGSS